jgi:hypothetical protein
MLAAKHLDFVLGIDAHVVLIPSPAGPVPTTVPIPFTGIVFDPLDYLPGIGASVWINGLPRALAGSAVLAYPPHLPLGGPFLKPPGNEGEVFVGSSTVACEGEPLAYAGCPVLTCQDIGFEAPKRFRKAHITTSPLLPTSMLLPIPSGDAVVVGGTPTVSFGALRKRAVHWLEDQALQKISRTLGRGLQDPKRPPPRASSRARRRKFDGMLLWNYGRDAFERLVTVLTK